MKKCKKVVMSLAIVMSLVMAVLVWDFDVQAASAANYSAIFNATYYSNRYADLKAVFGTNESLLLNHFINSGMAEGRQGSEEFNVQAYRARYADLNAAFGDNLPLYYYHYMNAGKAEGRSGLATGGQVVTTAVTNKTAAKSYEEQVVDLVNAERAKKGMNPLVMDATLTSAAEKRANETVGTFSHTRPNGSSCMTVLAEYGISYSTAGENIAAGQSTPEAVVAAWMNSTGHRANILNPTYGRIGVGCCQVNSGYGIYWAQLFTN